MALLCSSSALLRLPPLFLSLDRDAVDPLELSSLLAATGQNCLSPSSASPPQPPEPSKLRLALRHSTVVVSLHTNHHHAETLRGLEEGYGGAGHARGSDGSPPIGAQGLGLVADLSFLKDPWKKRRRTLVAFGRATSDEAFTASIYDLAVMPCLQRRGLGRRVLQKIVRELLRRDITDIAALTTPEQRPFFSACGFAEDELQTTTMMYVR